MVKSWTEKALLRASRGENLHRIENLELFEAGLIRYTDSVREIALTEQGNNILNRALSPDFASKRY